MTKTIKAQKSLPAVLLILDGFGIAPSEDGNAISLAKTPVLDRIIRLYPSMTLRASGEEVGLQWGEMGNSEVGHLTIGTGRVNYQLLPRINRSILNGSFYHLEGLMQAVTHVKTHGSRLHLMGLLSDGDVHASAQHLHALLEFASQQKVKEVFVHVFLDGRDTLYNAGVDHVEELQAKMHSLGVGRIASFAGRYYAMDRDHRWDRTKKAYDAIVLGQGESTENVVETIRDSYAKDVFDEQMLPTVVQEEGKPIGHVQDGDAIICFNFRSDRMRQLVQAFSFPEFDRFERTPLQNVPITSMASYGKQFPTTPLFVSEIAANCLAQVLSEQGLKQLHIAETEKYAHITYFLNGKEEYPFPQEDRELIPSPRVASYDQTPAMSTQKITSKIVKDLRNKKHDVILANLACADMVAHTGNLEATIQSIEAIDESLGKIVEATLAKEGVVFVVADHGNAEELVKTRTQGIDKEHSTNPVPFLVIGKRFEGQTAATGEVPEGDLSLLSPVGELADVAPTILSLLGIPQPSEMIGHSLL